MTAILYPVAANAEQALSRPVGRAARESDARRRAGEAVVFASDAVGPAFATRDAALDAYKGRVDDDRTGTTPETEDRYCRLIEQVADGAKRPKAIQPTYADGHRWPEPAKPTPTVWRLSISYWRIGTAERPLGRAPGPPGAQVEDTGRAGDPGRHRPTTPAADQAAATPGYRPVRDPTARGAPHRDAG